MLTSGWQKAGSFVIVLKGHLASIFEPFSSVWGGAIGIMTNWSAPRSAPHIKGESQGAMELSSNGLCSSSPGTMLNTTVGLCCCHPVQRRPVWGQGIWRSFQTRSAAEQTVSDSAVQRERHIVVFHKGNLWKNKILSWFCLLMRRDGKMTHRSRYLYSSGLKALQLRP